MLEPEIAICGSGPLENWKGIVQLFPEFRLEVTYDWPPSAFERYTTETSGPFEAMKGVIAPLGAILTGFDQVTPLSELQAKHIPPDDQTMYTLFPFTDII